ncbi:hypothetical protein LOK49_LG06G03426 [Camellia lanceoleosa]|uniref:Uncharacterized protein n=1 Tax=Camellia lanceoleosa TaxID=1840588 RepID=A0ACC0HE11_9ERIC|nr:hypothetical protein LOK49_LG06G03426 [Camellia lanceoleosa]
MGRTASIQRKCFGLQERHLTFLLTESLESVEGVVPRQQNVWYRPPIFSPLKSFMDFESGIEQWLIRRYITIHSFSGIAVHETWHGTSVGGGSLTSEREVRPIPFILV